MNNNKAMDKLFIDNEAVFEQLFKEYFRELHAYAFTLLKDWDVAEEIVQAMFLKIWEKEEAVQVQSSIKSYLYKSVYHSCLNYIRGQKVQLKYQATTAYSIKPQTDDTAQKLNMSELELHLKNALGKLPEKCREIFHLSRFEELKYQDIANRLHISVKTVEAQMSKALKILRKEMKEFLPVFIIMLFNIFRS
jgi:RNA polymerase sigma-70 factor (ECF subfamily)